MNSDDLTKPQIEALHASIRRSRVYLKKLLARMEEVAFDRDDGLRIEVEKINNQFHSLLIGLHYLGCKNQVGGNPFRKRPRYPR